MTPTLIHQVWCLVESTQAHQLLSLDDATLVGWIQKQLSAKAPKESVSSQALETYLQAKLSLIRDIAAERLDACA